MADDPTHVGRRSDELRSLRESIRAGEPLWGWGTEDGLIPWEDRHGRTMLVFWQSEARAIEENVDDEAEPGEKPLPFPISTLLEKLGAWAEKGVAVFGLEPRRGRILYSVTPDEFRNLLLGGSAAGKLP